MRFTESLPQFLFPWLEKFKVSSETVRYSRQFHRRLSLSERFVVLSTFFHDSRMDGIEFRDIFLSLIVVDMRETFTIRLSSITIANTSWTIRFYLYPSSNRFPSFLTIFFGRYDIAGEKFWRVVPTWSSFLILRPLFFIPYQLSV